MNNAPDSPLDTPLEKVKKHSKWLNLIWIEPKLAETEVGQLPLGIIVQKAEITMKLACFQRGTKRPSDHILVGIMCGVYLSSL